MSKRLETKFNLQKFYLKPIGRDNKPMTEEDRMNLMLGKAPTVQEKAQVDEEPIRIKFTNQRFIERTIIDGHIV